MEHGDTAAARALLEQLTRPVQLTDSPPAAVATPVPQEHLEPAPVEEPVPVAPPEVVWCEDCGARLSDALGWCPLCLKPGTSNRAIPVDLALPEPVPPVEHSPAGPTTRPGSARSAVMLALAVIAINIIVQATTYFLVRSSKVKPDTAISIGLWVSFGFYALIAVVALRNRAAKQVHMAWTVGAGGVSIRRGLLVGGCASALVLGLQSLALHHLVGDPTVRLVVSDGSIWRILAAISLFVVVAPVVEELVFRGVLAEALRHRGPRAAIAISALLFALAHLRPANLVYYTLIGLLLGRLYFRYGLKASIAAHAVFNGLLVGAAILSVVGPARTYTVEGAVIHLPAAWRTVPTISPSPSHLALQGPSASAIIVIELPVPAGTVFNPDDMRVAAARHLIPMPAGGVINSVRTVSYPAGQAALVDYTVGGQPGDVAVMIERSREWVFVLSPAGSSRATTDFNHMMQHLTLP